MGLRPDVTVVDNGTINLGFLFEISAAMIEPLNFEVQKISTEYK